MAPGLISPATVNLHHHSSPGTTTVTSQFPMICFPSCNFATNHATTSAFLIHRPFLLPPRNFSLWRARCGSTNSRPPSPPKSEPPAEEEPSSSSSSSPGLVATFSRFQESLRIFVAVFFWISLFFWSSVWDGRNNGRSDKGPRFRK